MLRLECVCVYRGIYVDFYLEACAIDMSVAFGWINLIMNNCLIHSNVEDLVMPN